MSGSKHSVSCELINNAAINDEIFRLDFIQQGGGGPKAGQFFMVKPKRSGVFLARPVSVAWWEPQSDTVAFLIALRGKGTQELAAMRPGEEAELIGPLGNAWADFVPGVHNTNKPVALIGGGVGLAPLTALLHEAHAAEHSPEYRFDLFAGFRTGFAGEREKAALLGPAASRACNVVIASEDGKTGHKGRIPDFLRPEQYAAVFACGPEPMLKAVAAQCKAAAVSCFISLERRMACGAGACLGCTVATVNGNRRCCADGPIFSADEVVFND